MTTKRTGYNIRLGYMAGNKYILNFLFAIELQLRLTNLPAG